MRKRSLLFTIIAMGLVPLFLNVAVRSMPVRAGGGTVEGYLYGPRKSSGGGGSGGGGAALAVGGAALLYALLSSGGGDKEPGARLLREAEAAYREARFDEAVQQAQEAIQKGLKKENRVKAYQWLAFACVGLKRTEEAKQAFREVFKIKLDYALPTPVSPRIESVFKEVRREFPPAATGIRQSSVRLLQDVGSFSSLEARGQTVPERTPLMSGGAASLRALTRTARQGEDLLIKPNPTATVPPNYQPRERATVTLWSDGTVVKETRTDEFGRFRLTNVPEGVYRLTVASEGDPLQCYVGVYDGETTPVEHPTTQTALTVQSPQSTMYRRPGQSVSVQWEYSESSPQNATVEVRKGNEVAGTVTVSGLLGGVRLPRTTDVSLKATAVDGTYNVVVNLNGQTATATDKVVLDGTLPRVTWHTPTDGARDVSVHTTITATFSEPMDRASVEAAFSITPSVPGAFTWSDNTLTFTPTNPLEWDTRYTVRLAGTATDLAGNPLPMTSWSFTTVAVPPPTIEEPADGTVTKNPRIPVRGQADPGATVTVFDNGTRLGETTADGQGHWQFTPTTPLAEVQHALTATATIGEKTSSPSSVVLITVDTTPPTVTPVGVTPDPAGVGTVNFSLAFSEIMNQTVAPTVTFGLTNPYNQHAVTGNWTDDQHWSGDFTVDSTTGDGLQHVCVSGAQDAAGNPMLPDTSRTFRIDTRKPTSTVTLPENGKVYDSLPTLSGTCDDGTGSGVAQLEVSIQRESDGKYWNDTTWQDEEDEKVWLPTTLSPDGKSWSKTKGLPKWADGNYTVRSRATDKAGNVESPGPGNRFTYDSGPPVVTSVRLSDQDSGSEVWTNDRTVNIAITESADVEKWIVSETQNLRPAGNAPEWTSPEPTSFTLTSGDGPKTVYVWVKDRAGRVSEAGKSDSITLDMTPPVSQAGLLDATQTSLNFNVPYTANDSSGSGMDYVELWFRRDGGEWIPYQPPSQPKGRFTASPIPFTATGNGQYDFYTIAVDKAGNREPAPAGPDTTTQVNAWPKTTGSGVYSSPALGDIDGDGQLEVVVGSDDKMVYAWNGDGSTVPGWPKTTGGLVRSSPALGDVDGDGKPEVVVGSGGGKVYAWNDDGSAVPGWPQTTGSAVWSSPALGDIDGDGQLEVMVGSQDKKVYAWNGDGSLRPGWPQTTGLYIFSSPALADMDGDGRLEVVVGSDDNKVYAWKGDGSAVPGWPQPTGGSVGSSPALGDIDGDGQLEVVVGSMDNKVYVWHCPLSNVTPNSSPWPMFHHDRHHTGLYGYSPGSRAATAERVAWQWTLQARTADGATARAVLGAGNDRAAGRTGQEPVTLRLRGERAARLLPESPRLEWNVTVENEGGPETVTLTWPDLSRVPGRYRLTLTDRDAGGKRVSLRTRTSYTYRTGPADGPRHFLIVADATPQLALAITNLTATPGRGGEVVRWCYTLSREAEVTAQVETLAGRRIAVAEEQTSRAAGVNTLAWDGRDEQGRPVPNGIYLLRVVARTEEGESVPAVRTVRIER